MWCRILLVDDDPQVLNALRRELLRKPDLNQEGIEIESYSRADEALRRIAEPDGLFDAAIVDYRMPDIDGITLLERMRERQPDMVRILLTGLIDIDGAVAAINEARVDQIISKPWQEYDLKARIALVLQQKALIRRIGQNAVAAGDVLARPYLMMLVDDEAAQLNALEREVSFHGRATHGAHALFEIVKATHAEEALILSTQRCPDIVIADHQMPGMNGIDLLSAIRAHCPRCVGILLSGHADTQMLVKAVNEAGIYHFVGKPWDATALRSVIAEALAYRDLIHLAS